MNVNMKLHTDPTTMEAWRARNKQDGFALAFAGSEIKALRPAISAAFGDVALAFDDAGIAHGTPLEAWHGAHRKIVQALCRVQYKKACLSLRNAFKRIPKYMLVMQEQAALAVEEADAAV